MSTPEYVVAPGAAVVVVDVVCVKAALAASARMAPESFQYMLVLLSEV